MRFALDVAPLGDLADPLTMVRLAEAAEAAGWDGFSTWDTLGLAQGTVAADPFVALAGAAAATERIRSWPRSSCCRAAGRSSWRRRRPPSTGSAADG